VLGRSTIRILISLDGLIEEFPWDPGQVLGFKPPLHTARRFKKREKKKKKHTVQYTDHERKNRHKESYALLTYDNVKFGETRKGCMRS
jgi:hypothetical protein